MKIRVVNDLDFRVKIMEIDFWSFLTVIKFPLNVKKFQQFYVQTIFENKLLKDKMKIIYSQMVQHKGTPS